MSGELSGPAHPGRAHSGLAHSGLAKVASRWTELGERDPLWAALTLRGRSGGRWDGQEFLSTGDAEITAVLDRLATLGVPPRRGTALDFGCGPGRLSRALAEAGFERVIGLDISTSMLAAAAELVPDPRCEFRHNEGSRLEGVPDDSVDLVYTCRVLQHMPPTLAHGYLREFFRVTAPGGLVVFQLPDRPAPGLVGELVRGLPAPVLNRLRRGMEMYGTPADEVERLVTAAGGRMLAVDDDTSAGPRWRSHLYLARVEAPGPIRNPGPRR